jgi:hypothetical protein
MTLLTASWRLSALPTLTVLLFLLSGCGGADTPAARPAPYLTQLDTADGRSVTVRVWSPGGNCDPCDAMFFSHGNFLSIDQYDEILGPWSDAGYLIVAPLHVDSESHPERDLYAQTEVFPTRMKDVEATIAALQTNQPHIVGETVLSGRILATGHSYGALVAQIFGGATFEGAFSYQLDSDRQMPAGVIALSPPGPFEGYIFADGWTHLSVPQVVVTGTNDSLPNFAPDWRAHLVSHEVAPEGLSVALVFDDIDHYFNGAIGRLKPGNAARNEIVSGLNERVLQFAEFVLEGGAPSDEQWQQLEAVGIEALAR